MSNACPLNFTKVDSNVSRFNALFVAILVITYLYTENIYILLFLFFDFVLKLFLNPGVSPIMMLAEFLKNIFHIVTSLIITHFLHIWLLSLSLALVFLACSLLDVFFDYCIGCKIYFIIKKIYPNFMNHL